MKGFGWRCRVNGSVTSMGVDVESMEACLVWNKTVGIGFGCLFLYLLQHSPKWLGASSQIFYLDIALDIVFFFFLSFGIFCFSTNKILIFKLN